MLQCLPLSILTKNTKANLKRHTLFYFQCIIFEIIELKGEEFPVDLDEVWGLVYGQKSDAVKVLKKEYVENDDYQVLRQNPQNSSGGRPGLNYKLTTSCLEYFIAKKVRPVFEVYRNEITFQLGNGDTMVNATEMAKSFGKRPVDWTRLPTTVSFLEALAKVRKSHNIDSLVVTKRGLVNGGTWMHEDVALEFAQWLSMDFKIWCNARIKELMQHGFTITDSKLDSEATHYHILLHSHFHT